MCAYVAAVLFAAWSLPLLIVATSGIRGGDASLLRIPSAMPPWYPSESIVQYDGKYSWNRLREGGNIADHHYSSWMGDHATVLANRSLLNLTLPGTHDSAAYEMTLQVMPGSLPWPLAQLLQIAAQSGLPLGEFIIHWAISQDQSVRQQLEAGVRFLDLRAGFNGSHWVTCHSMVGPVLFPVLVQIAEFLEAHPREVLVVEMTHIYNAGIDLEAVLARLIQRVLGKYMLPCCRADMTFEAMWRQRAQLIFVTSLEPRNGEPWWPPASIWGGYANSDDVETMYNYNLRQLSSETVGEHHFNKLSWILTPQLTTLAKSLFEPPATLIDLADTANPLLGDFVDAALEARPILLPQIIIADHYEMADIVAMALQASGLDL